MLKLKARRVELGLTQKQLASKIGVKESQFQQWEYGNVTPNYLNARRWANALEIDMNTFDAYYIK